MTKLLRQLARDRCGATAIEYSLLGSLIAVVIIVSVQLLGTNLTSLFERIAAAFA
jgi:pilus assembly protein Flp/PilA